MTTAPFLRCLPLALLFAGPGCQLAAAQDASACDDLFRHRIEDVDLLSSARVPAGGDLPAYCRVLGVVRPAIHFEVRLPLERWNQKLYMAGCGGYCGSLDSDLPDFVNAMNHGLRRHYAVSTMDSGHWGASAVDGRWAWNNRQAEIDWGYRAVTETARATKELISAFYGRPQTRSYFAGCSTGGRMAAMEAQRFPKDFDGIVAGAPALDETGLVAVSMSWLVQANTDAGGKAILNRSKVALLANAVQRKCANADGVIDDPAACGFQPAELQCRAGDAPDCLTAQEVGVLDKWYSDVRNAKGEVLYPGAIPKGSEPFWPLWLTGDEKGSTPLMPLFARDFLRYMAFADDPGEDYGVMQFNLDTDPVRLRRMGQIYNATDPDLSRFRDRGGKLIMVHGLADAIIPPGISLAYWKSVSDALGGPAAVSSFFRLFLVPGFDHCGYQPGPGVTQNGIDPLSALENWVEKGMAPDVLVSTRPADGGGVQRVRPLCAYPGVARFIGGNANDPARYECVGR